MGDQPHKLGGSLPFAAYYMYDRFELNYFFINFNSKILESQGVRSINLNEEMDFIFSPCVVYEQWLFKMVQI